GLLQTFPESFSEKRDLVVTVMLSYVEVPRCFVNPNRSLARGVPLMGWSGRAPAPPASEADKGRQRQGARHVSDTQYCDRRDRHRYRQELISRRGSRCARRCRAPAKVVAWPSGSAARQYTALPDRHGSLRRRTSPEPQTRIAWSRCQVNAG